MPAMSNSGEDSNEADAWIAPDPSEKHNPGPVVDEALHRATMEQLLGLETEVRHVVQGMRMEFGSYWVRRFLLRRSIRMSRFRAVLMDCILDRRVAGHRMFEEVVNCVQAPGQCNHVEAGSQSQLDEGADTPSEGNHNHADSPDNPWGIDNGEIINISSESEEF